MQLARVIGTVVATIKSPGLEGVKFLIIQPLDRAKQPSGAPLVAADAVYMAGPGELVYFVAAREASQALRETFVPVDHAIVGIVDAVEAIGRGGSARSAATAGGPVGRGGGDQPGGADRPGGGTRRRRAGAPAERRAGAPAERRADSGRTGRRGSTGSGEGGA